MKAGGGHRKGAAFEREVAKLIVKAFRKHKAFREPKLKQAECWRSVLSGGHEMSCGDLRMSDRLAKVFPFAVECKNYRIIDWQHFLFPPSQRDKTWKEWQWVKQAEEAVYARPDCGLKALLVLKENRSKRIYAMWRAKKGNMRMMYFSEFLKLRVAK